MEKRASRCCLRAQRERTQGIGQVGRETRGRQKSKVLSMTGIYAWSSEMRVRAARRIHPSKRAPAQMGMSRGLEVTLNEPRGRRENLAETTMSCRGADGEGGQILA